jgi:uncharacterized protein with PIN domain
VTPADAVNLDTSAATGFVAEGSAARGLLKAFVQGRAMLMCAAAEAEFLNAVALRAGPREQARAARFLARITRVPDSPSPRVLALRITRAVKHRDRIIFGTGDALGVVTATADGRFVRAAAGQGVTLAVFLHAPGRFRGL